MELSSLVPAGLQPNQLSACNVEPGYNKISENLRRYTPASVQCAIFCGGSRCKYENPKSWPAVHMAIRNIYSHWVTDNVLAMARPSTAQIVQMNIIEQFQEWSIKTIINLQTPGEHASCGGPLLESGFTYDPNIFMKNGIYYYNFIWRDYGGAATDKLLDMVKVVAFAVQEGRVAIHCHAGLGRTGVLIACYLVYSLRVRASDAIRFVRMKRPSAIQTRGQILCVQEFEHFVLPQMILYPIKNLSGYKRSCDLQAYLKKQQTILHGYELRSFKHIPKLIFMICERILQLCNCSDDNSPAEIVFDVSSTPFTQKFVCYVLPSLVQKNMSMRNSYSWTDSLADSSLSDLSSIKAESSTNLSSPKETLNAYSPTGIFCDSPEAPSCSSSFNDDNAVDDVLNDGIRDQTILDNDCYLRIQSIMNLKSVVDSENPQSMEPIEVVKILLHSYQDLPDVTKKRIQDYQIDLNVRSTSWQRIKLETDIHVLSALLYEWLETLDPPILDVNDLCQIVVRSTNPKKCLQKLPVSVGYVLEYLLRFVSRIRPMSMEHQNALIKRLMASITQQKVLINRTFLPSGKRLQNLRFGTMNKLLEFMTGLTNVIEEVNTQQLDHWSVSRWSLYKALQENGKLTEE